MSTSTINLCGKWQFRQKGKGAYLPATVPGSVHTDLLANKLIPDPFAGDNELKLQWIEQTDWEYQREFVVTAKLLRQQRVELVCEGLDTVAAITVNGSKVASVENMFIGYRFNVKQILRPGRNSIHVHFTAPATYIKMHRHLCTCTPPNDPMGGSCVIRKEPCSFGWDWGPRLATSGIYLPIRIEGRPAWRISAVDVRQTHRIGAVSLSCVPAIDARSSKGISWRSRLSINGKLVAESKSLHLTVKNPKLWWPNGLGAQPLYTLTVELLHNGALVDTWTRRIGLRTITLDRHKDEWGQSFQFLVNGVPVFAKGANWVPAHSFQASVTREMYDDLLTSAVQANMNIIRAWGGGVYENDEFFDLCDEKGLLVWQDFMFACGLYPGNPAFLASVTREFEYQIPRLAHHASLALWCGNNELEMWLKGIIETPERKKAYEDIFYRILPAVTKRLNPARPYWPCSPHNPWGYEKGLVAGEKGGDTHDWAVWHGRMRPDHFERTNNRFVSEYGMQSYASIETTRQFADPKAVNVFDAVMENHQKCASGNSLIFHYIAQQYRFPRDFASLVYLSQANQAYVVKTAAEHYRRSMPRTMGSIYWQINDCWPVASWASIEFGGRWKALQYASKRFYAPVLVSARRTGEESVGSINRQVNKVTGCDIYTVSDSVAPVRTTLRWTLYHLDGRKLLAGSRKVLLRYGQSVVQKKLDLHREFAKYGKESIYLHVYLTGQSAILSQNTVFFTSMRFVDLPREKLNPLVKKVGSGQFRLVFRSKTYQHMVAVDVAGIGFRMSDNWFDLYPGIPHAVELSVEKDCTAQQLRKRMSVVSLADSY